MVFAEGMCMKHTKRWRSKLEWLTNQFRKKRKDVIGANRLKMEEFVTSFMNLMCTCNVDGQRKPQLKEINGMVVFFNMSNFPTSWMLYHLSV